MENQQPSISRVVHYVLEDGQHRPAIIVRVWGEEHASSVQLQVFTDGGNDGLDNVVWRTSVIYSEEPKPFTWHWPERV